MLINDQMPDLSRYAKPEQQINALYQYIYSFRAHVNHVLSNLDSENLGSDLKTTIADIQQAVSEAVQQGVQPEEESEQGKPTLTAEDVGLGKVANVLQYSKENEPPYPVTAVNGKTGDVKLAASDVGAAHAGYGLGETTPRRIGSLDEITASGYYTMWFDTANGDPVTGNFVFTAITDGRFNNVHIQSKIGGGYIHRDKWDGVWQPWEWVNPPMVLGVEYRTTERYMGKPVYAVLVNCGALPANSSKTVNVCLYATTPVRAEWSIVNNSNPLRYSDISHAGATNNFYSSASDGITAVVIGTTSNLSGFNAVLAYYYTKD